MFVDSRKYRKREKERVSQWKRNKWKMLNSLIAVILNHINKNQRWNV